MPRPIENHFHQNFFIYNFIKFLLGLMMVIPLFIFAQALPTLPIVSEAPLLFKDGMLKSTQLTVHFNFKALDLSEGETEGTLSDLKNASADLRAYFAGLEQKYGAITFVKQIPSAKWGDVWRKARGTGKLVKIKDMSQLYALRFSQFVPIDEIIAELENMPEVQYAHRPVQAIPLHDPNDPKYTNGEQWALSKIGAPNAWDITKGNSNVIVGIIEVGGPLGSGVPDRNHIDFVLSNGDSKFVPGKGDFSQVDGVHATNVAGIIGAATNDSEGIAALGYNIRMIPYAFLGNSPSSLVADINRAYAIDSVDVINCSFVLVDQGTTFDCDLDPGPPGSAGPCIVYKTGDFQSVRDEIANAITAGAVVVAGTGNTGLEITNQNQQCNDCLPIRYTPYPANYPGVIGVSATDINDNFGQSTGGVTYNSGSFVDVSAPGIDILTTGVNDSYNTKRGTSFSSPHVAALAGLILSIDSTLTPAEVEQIIEDSAVDLGPSGDDPKFGSGRIDAYAAVVAAPPNAPQNLTAANITDAILLAWEANNEPDLAGYEVYRKINSGSIQKISGNNLVTTNSYVDGGLQIVNNSVTEHTYYVKAVDNDNKKSTYSIPVAVDVEYVSQGGAKRTADDSEIPEVPAHFALEQNYPNPFNPTTTFAFALPEATPVRLTIFDLAGRQVAELLNRELPAGRYEIPFDASNLASGVYLYRLSAGSFTQTRKMMLMK